ncbi:aldo/keto reductase [Paraburkholderia sp. UYCP14C]|uniref:aldo/keto reductase n=1 Tax=Paraburkholderia sp. UYCP14C TaxID=2511130 RepID=UPI00101EB9D2|nr:aldo/keto reductase [Paraburkholderia sp. UYCP14C]RZF24349.1 aldo/keto reductase [Paraburkholderia sp. UYCP14C]
MNPVAKQKWPRSGLETTVMGFGAAQLGNFFRPITEEDAAALIKSAWDAGVRYFDTAPSYGHGLSEARCGQGLRWYPRDQLVLSTKVGRLLKPRKRAEIDFAPWVDGLPFEWHFDYSYDGTMRSIEDSLQRMGLAHIDIALIHEVDVYTHGSRQPDIFEAAMSGAAKALLRLRDEGVVKSIGVGVNECEAAREAIERVDFDCLLLAGRYTLIEQDALDTLLPMCEQWQVSVIVGGGYNSGILATGAVAGAKYNYAPAPEPILDRVRRIEQVCREFNVPLKSASLQFVVGHPAIPTIIPGVRSLAQLDENLRTFKADIPPEFWVELRRRELIRPDAPTH